MTLVIQNASAPFAKALRELAKIDGATVTTKYKRKNLVQLAIEQVENGETERFATLDDFKRAMEA